MNDGGFGVAKQRDQKFKSERRTDDINSIKNIKIDTFILLSINLDLQRRRCSRSDERENYYSFFINVPCVKISKRQKMSIPHPVTVFENHRKSLIQLCERSELRLNFD